MTALSPCDKLREFGFKVEAVLREGAGGAQKLEQTSLQNTSPAMSGDLQNCSRARCRSSAREECSAGPHKFAAIPKSSPCNRETPAKSFETVAPGKYYVSLYCIMRTLFALNYISPSLPPVEQAGQMLHLQSENEIQFLSGI